MFLQRFFGSKHTSNECRYRLSIRYVLSLFDPNAIQNAVKKSTYSYVAMYQRPFAECCQKCSEKVYVLLRSFCTRGISHQTFPATLTFDISHHQPTSYFILHHRLAVCIQPCNCKHWLYTSVLDILTSVKAQDGIQAEKAKKCVKEENPAVVVAVNFF
jgi:sulfur transfer complex TusBCD TusB component (DsrH family)